MAVWCLPTFAAFKHGFAMLWLGIFLMLVAGIEGRSYAQTLSHEERTLPLDEFLKRLESAEGSERLRWQLGLFQRLEAPIQTRLLHAEEILGGSYPPDKAPYILGSANLAKAVALFQQGEVKKSIEFLEVAESYGESCKETEPQIYFNALCNRALYLITLGERSEAPRLLNEAIQFGTPFGSRLNVAHAYLSLALLAESTGASSKAIEFIGTAFELATKADQIPVACAAGDTLVALLHSEGNREQARAWIEKTRPWVEKCTDPRIAFSFTMHVADVKTSHGDAQGATEDLRALLAKDSPNIDRQLIGNAYISLAGSLYAMNDFDGARLAAEEAIDRLKNFERSYYLAHVHRLDAMLQLGAYSQVAESVDSLVSEGVSLYPKIRLLELQSRAYEQLGKPVEALRALRASSELEQQRLKERAQEQVSFMDALFRDRERESQLALLEEQQRSLKANVELNARKLEQQNSVISHAAELRRRTVFFSICLFFLGCLLTVGYFHRKHTLTVRSHEKALNSLLEERLKRQAEDLHREISARRDLELEVERKRQFEALGKLTGGVAHDFNNLLTIILSSNELIQKKLPSNTAEIQELLKASSKAAESGASIITQLLSYARQKPQSPKAVQVTAWLQSVSTLFRKTVGDSIQLTIRDESDGAVIMIDSAQLTTSILNLLSNARDAVEKDGKIDFFIRQRQLDAESAGTWSEVREGAYIEFEVRDNGKGIAKQDLARICEPFFTTKEAAAGTGLGLSSVLGFIKQSQGDLRIASEIGQGTTVKFLIPVTTNEVIEKEEAVVEPERPKGRTILLVDDQDDVRFVLVSKLEAMGFQVHQADSAKAAIQWLQHVAHDALPEVVLSDVKMPGPLSGVELRYWIASKFPNLRVILMSGYSDSDSWSPDFLPKPFSQQELERVLNRA